MSCADLLCRFLKNTKRTVPSVLRLDRVATFAAGGSGHDEEMKYDGFCL